MSNIAQIASEGDELKTLIELRDNTAVRLEQTQSDQNYTMLSRLMMDTIEKIKALQGATNAGGTALDELAKRRAASGRPNTTRQAGAPRQAQ